MDSIPCSNCESLKVQCKELKTEVTLLTQKLDNLLELVLREHCNKSSQTDLITTESSMTNTEHGDFVSPDSSDTASDISYDMFRNANSSLEVTNPNPHMECTQDTIPCYLVPNQPFNQFKFKTLDDEIPFIRVHGNRSTCFYGQYSYAYGNIVHEPRPLPPSNSYLYSILAHLHNVIPNIQYNSVLVTKYNDGKDNLGFHSDNESEIVADSDIVTISLGGPRVACFKKISDPDGTKFDFPLKHGSVFIMSKNSQSHYEHCIPPDSSSHPRISITCRLLQPSPLSQSTPDVQFPMPADTSAPIISAPNQDIPLEGPHQSTVYISSSMFRGIDETKMSSQYHTAKVFYYPGATAKQLLAKVQNDPKFLLINPNSVTKVYLLCGTNNIDQILGVQKRDHSNFTSNCPASEELLHEAKSDIYNLITHLHAWAQSASINVLNLLPRVSASRNSVINLINCHIKQICDNLQYAYFVGTEMHRSLFSFQNGMRKDQFFSIKGSDNVHLNRSGVIRLAKYLKYFAHQNTSNE